jgi:hypothetical protein
VGHSPLKIKPPLQGKPQIRYKSGLFLLLFCFFSFACRKQSARLKWEDTSDKEEGFRIYRITANDTKKIAEVGPNVTSYVDQNALSGACYPVVLSIPRENLLLLIRRVCETNTVWHQRTMAGFPTKIRSFVPLFFRTR